MRASLLSLLILVVSETAAFGQSTLSFAYLMNKAEMPNVRFAVVNPAAQDAQTTFTLYGPVGRVIETSTVMIPRGGQVMKSATDLFPSAGNGGWVQARSDSNGLRGFWIVGDARTVGDGAEAQSSGTDLTLPLITDQSEIIVVNTGSAETAIRMRLYGGSGQEVAEPAVRVLPPRGSFRATSRTLFSALDWAAATHARISSGSPIVASARVSNFRVAPSLAMVNAVSTATAPSGFVFPHVVQGPAGGSNYITVLGVTNMSAASQNITLTFVSADGSSPKTIQQSLRGNGGLRASARTIFGFGDEFRSGWVRVTAPQGAIGFAANADAEGGAAITAGMFRPQSSFIFGHIADLSPWWTGLTLLNPGQTTASVELFAMSPEGTLIGGAENTPTARFEIPPNGRASRLLSEWIPKTQARTADGGFVFVRSSAPLHGLSLFFTRDLRILSIVPAFDLSPGIAFDPPRPGAQ